MPDRQITRFQLRRLGLVSVLKFCFVLGAAASLFPSLALSFLTLRLVSLLRWFLEGLRGISQTIPLINVRITTDYVNLLHLSDILKNLQYVDSHAWFFGLLLFGLLLLGSALTLGIAMAVAALVYNVLAKGIGGLEIELESLPPRR